MKSDKFYKAFVTIIAVAVAGAVLFEIVFAPTSVGSPASESDALVRASERLIEMVKWTISTIFIIGGALIGLNWYSNEHRYREDQANLKREYADLKNSLERRVLTIEATNTVLQQKLLETKLDITRVTSQITHTMLFEEQSRTPADYVGAVIRVLERPDASEIIRSSALDLVISIFDTPDASESFVAYLGADKVPALIVAARDRGHDKEADELEQAYQQYLDKNKGTAP